MNALTAFTGTPQFHQIETILNALTNDARYLLSNGDTYPPYNAWFEENGDCMIELAVAGFTKDELLIEFDGTTLLIKGDKAAKTDENDEAKRTWVKRGLARRAFVRKFEIRGAYLLDSANMKNGILTVTLKNDTKKISVTITE
jgi:molecular chaperone IbpA